MIANVVPAAVAARPDIQAIRRQFPSLKSGTVFFENAGGTQMPRVVADAIHHYLLNTYVNTGAGYEASKAATKVVQDAHAFINLFMNGVETGHTALGHSTSMLCRILADCYAEILQPGDEIIIAENSHESNVGPWVRLARWGFKVTFWKLDRQSQTCRIEDLEKLLNPRVKIVAFPKVSNILGEIADAARIVKLAHAAGAQAVVDGVAYAPHHPVDVAALDADWYVYSTYKVFGPHMAALYGKREAFARLNGPNHFFIPKDKWPGKFELGGACHEGCAGLLAIGKYLNFLAGRDEAAPVARQTILDAYETIRAQELKLQQKLIGYLQTKPQVRIVGPNHAEPSRISLVCFVHQTKPSNEIVAQTDRAGIGIKYGHMAAWRLCEALGFDPTIGVVRASLAHYNTVEEIDRLIEVLERTL